MLKEDKQATFEADKLLIGASFGCTLRPNELAAHVDLQGENQTFRFERKNYSPEQWMELVRIAYDTHD